MGVLRLKLTHKIKEFRPKAQGNMFFCSNDASFSSKKPIFARVSYISHLIIIKNIMMYKIIDIQGIGETYAQKLSEIGIRTASDLLDKCKTSSGRKAVETQTGISGKLILTWTNHADLFRVTGIGPQFAELLEAAGVDTVRELGHRVPENLQQNLEQVNAEKNLTNRVPSVRELQKMIEEAKGCPSIMEY